MPSSPSPSRAGGLPVPGLSGAAAKSHAAAEAVRQETAARQAEAQADARALARALAALACRMTGLPGPDALRAVASREDSLRVLRVAGHDVEAIAGNLQPGSVRRQSSVTRSPYEADPVHDQRFVAAQLRGGDVLAALREIAGDGSVPARAARARAAVEILENHERIGVAEAMEIAELPPGQRAARLQPAGALSPYMSPAARVEGGFAYPRVPGTTPPRR